MKVHRLLLLAALLVLSFPVLGRADDDREGDDDHHTTRAPEMVQAGQIAAGLLGLAGYIAVRRRSASHEKN